MATLHPLAFTALAVIRTNLLFVALVFAYRIRLFAVDNFGRVIHEFDPWFNYRAAEYLAEHGPQQFFTWFDHMAWYPLGRPVGTTIYPGMQFVAVWAWEALNSMGYFVTLNDVCVFIPAWFGVAATVFLGLLTWECSGCIDSAIWASFIMSIVPAHIMRSVAGGFDNECVAITFMIATFFLWCRSLRTEKSWPFAVVAGMSYFCMVATWGGYVFVINLIAAHAAALTAFKGSEKVHRSYSLFFLFGTALAVHIPVVGWTPLKSLEQMGPLGVFLALQVLEALQLWRRRFGLSDGDFQRHRFLALAVSGIIVAFVSAGLFQHGFFAPISARVRGLFVKHTRTGNPLVDSVAEHQATSSRAYWQYLHYAYNLAPIGFCIGLWNLSDANVFLLLYAATSYYFSAKMNRLILLLGPVAAALGGIAVAKLLCWAIGQFLNIPEEGGAGIPEEGSGAAAPQSSTAATPSKKRTRHSKTPVGTQPSTLRQEFQECVEALMEVYQESRLQRKMTAGLLLFIILACGFEFISYCFHVAERLSQASIVQKMRQQSGEEILVDDYREAYWWLKENTTHDARVLAWWDYGYQINGVANRTTLADGNTWNHEHIALLGRCMTGPERASHEVIRHLADYVLIWAGGGGDDLAKSPHMARIASSVYTDHCFGDALCSSYRVNRTTGAPTQMMAESLLWKLHGHNLTKDVKVDFQLFEEAYTSRWGFVRIFRVLNVSQESRTWAGDANNWNCDAPGSWYCQGQYPPALAKTLKKKRAFQQLEDFNVHRDAREE